MANMAYLLGAMDTCHGNEHTAKADVIGELYDNYVYPSGWFESIPPHSVALCF